MKKIMVLVLMLIAFEASAQAVNVTLLWNAPATAPAGYNVYRSATMGGPYTTKLNATLVTALTYVDMNAPASVLFYVTRSVNAAGIESGNSNELRVDASAPQPPTNLRLGGISIVNLFVNGSKVATGPADQPLMYTIPRHPPRAVPVVVVGQ
jgi:hypothetical protein